MNNFPSALSDSELVDKATQMFTVINASAEDYGATNTQGSDLEAKTGDFATALTAHLAAQADARSKTQSKDASRKILEDAIRFLIQQAKLKKIPESQIAAMGVPVGESSALPSTVTKPTAKVDTSQRFQHTIDFADEATPNSKQKPRGVFGCEICVKIGGAPPVGPDECETLAIDRKTPYLSVYDPEDVGKMAHYMLRWHLNDETRSPWSETISATITG
ncbi:MAG TPA: hypothetical protein PKY59_10315 [Pyrinomonadaceae bacterium]|nr:hypothetical protein [Pyrinomonadaceae bacterium]